MLRGRNVRLIASDLDGTLFGLDHQLSAYTVDVLRETRAAGIRVIASTGRAPLSAGERVGRRGVVDTLVCSNGSIVHDPATGETVDRFPIDPDHLVALFASLDGAIDGLSYCWELADSYGWDAGFSHIGERHADTFAYGVAERPGPDDAVTKVMVAHPELKRTELRDALLPHLAAPLTLGCSGVEFVEVTGEGVNKAATVAGVAARMGIDATDTIAFGDNANDLELLTWAGLGVAVENALDETKAAADLVIGHHADDAVATFIASLLG